VENQIKGNHLTRLHVFTRTSFHYAPIQTLNVCEHCSVAARTVISYSFLYETRSWGTTFFICCLFGSLL